MTSDRGVTADDVIERIRAEIEAGPVDAPDVSFGATLERVQTMQRDYRVSPLGGRLLPLKRLARWFVASSFDRQAKVVEALIDVVREMGEELEELRVEERELRSELRRLRKRSVGGS